MIIWTVAGFVALCSAYLLGKIHRHTSEVKFHREALEYKLMGENFKILEEINRIKDELALLQINTAPIGNIEKMVMFAPKFQASTGKKLPAANRNPRTEEQKRRAAEKRKAWWVSKRAEEAQKQEAPTPGV